VTQAVVDASWRAEGMAVLAWALGTADLPAHDELVQPGTVADGLGFLGDEVPLLEAPRLRLPSELERMQRRLLGLHWRLRDYQLFPRALDLRALAAKCWFGSFDLDGIALCDGDLAIGGVPISLADADQVTQVTSIARERHQAINWLCGDCRRYSHVGTST
jgi:hypothetical protein